ncbi:MAG: hypothetical protein HY787_15225 [Deltaproteobacteria bacterium]|nr:hypothetical protein [Deltaproteobacteria bacterium]
MNSAYLNKETGQIFYHSEMSDYDEIGDEELEGDQWLSIPHQNDLDLGQQLVFEFVETHLNDKYEQVRQIFRRPGAYGRFKDLLGTRNQLETWYEFENQRTREALKEWCEENDVEWSD